MIDIEKESSHMQIYLDQLILPENRKNELKIWMERIALQVEADTISRCAMYVLDHVGETDLSVDIVENVRREYAPANQGEVNAPL